MRSLLLRIYHFLHHWILRTMQYAECIKTVCFMLALDGNLNILYNIKKLLKWTHWEASIRSTASWIPLAFKRPWCQLQHPWKQIRIPWEWWRRCSCINRSARKSPSWWETPNPCWRKTCKKFYGGDSLWCLSCCSINFKNWSYTWKQ